MCQNEQYDPVYVLERPKHIEITFALLAFCALLLFLSLSKDSSATTYQAVHLPFSYDPTGPCWDCRSMEGLDYIGVSIYSGNLEISKGNYFEAIGYFDKVLENDPTNIIALQGKGYALANIGKYDDAISSLDKVLKIYTHNPIVILIKEDALYGKAVSLANLGKYQEAAIYYDKILKMDPKFSFTETDMKVIQKFTK